MRKSAGQEEQEYPESEQEDLEYFCVPCGKTFATLHGLRSHNAVVHGYKRPAQFFLAGSVCPVCQLDCRTRSRAMRHLERAARCREAMESGSLQRISDEQAAAAAQVDRNHRHACRKAGVREDAGPPAVRPRLL